MFSFLSKESFIFGQIDDGIISLKLILRDIKVTIRFYIANDQKTIVDIRYKWDKFRLERLIFHSWSRKVTTFYQIYWTNRENSRIFRSRIYTVNHPIEKLRAFSTHLYSSVSRLFHFRPINFLTPSRILMWKFLRREKVNRKIHRESLVAIFFLSTKSKGLQLKFWKHLARFTIFFST